MSRLPSAQPSRKRSSTSTGKSVVDVCAVDELRQGQRAFVQAGPRQIAVFNIRGQLFALPNVCSHQRGPLCTGSINGTLVADAESGWKPVWEYEGEVITCPWHGLEFHIPSGQCLAYPNVRIRSYEVFVENGMVKVAV